MTSTSFWDINTHLKKNFQTAISRSYSHAMLSCSHAARNGLTVSMEYVTLTFNKRS